MEKSKRLPLGVQKKTTSTKQITKKKKLFSNVLNYLKSDCYMFAPLLSPSLSGLKSKEPIKENNKMRVLKMVGKYMKSDTYMYSPLLSSQPTAASPSSEQIQCSREVTVEVATRMLTAESANATAEKQPCEDAPPGLSIADNQTVKHMVYHQRRRCSTPVSAGKAMAGMKLGKLVVE